MSQVDKINKQIKFLNQHVGGSLDDNTETFTNQKKIITDNDSTYDRTLDNFKQIDKNKDVNKDFVND